MGFGSILGATSSGIDQVYFFFCQPYRFRLYKDGMIMLQTLSWNGNFTYPPKERYHQFPFGTKSTDIF